MYLLIKSVVLFIGTAGFGLLDAEFVDEVCVLPVDIGVSCDNVNPQMHFYFNKYLEQCVPFMYKGCGGNGNRFLHSDDCTDACQVEWYKNKKSRKSESSIEEDRIVTPADCNEPAKPGPCRALNVQWFYDSKSGICRMFNYGGCMGNKNRFDTETQCQLACVSKNS